MFVYFKKKIITIPLFDMVVPIIAFFVLIEMILTLNKGLTMNDEAWYLTLIKYAPAEISFTHFFHLFKGLFQGSIVDIRIFTFSILIFSTFIFSLGLCKYFQKEIPHSFIPLFSLAIISLFLLTAPVCLSLSYISLGLSISGMSIGLLLIGLSLQNEYLQSIFLLLSGFIAGFIFFVQITFISLFIISLFILLLNSKKKKYINLSIFLIGILFSLIFYFSLFQSPEEFFRNIFLMLEKVGSDQGKIDESHGLTQLLRWVLETVSFFISNILTITLSLLGLDLIKSRFNKKLYLASIAVVVIFFVFDFYYNTLNSSVGSSSFIAFYIILIYLIFQILLIEKFEKNLIIMILISSIPFLASFGSDMPFRIRGSVYILYVIPIIYLLLQKVKIAYLTNIFLLLITINFLVFIGYYFKTNWADIVYSQQKINLKESSIAQNLKLNKDRVNEFNLLRKNIDIADTIVLGNSKLWGYSYLLETVPLVFDFRRNDENILSALNNNSLNKFIMLEYNDYKRFPENLMNSVGNNYSLSKKINTERFNIYYFAKTFP